MHPHTNYYVGGNTKFYGAALFRLRAEDFGEIRHHGGISPAWPVSYDDMEPHYTAADQLYHVHGNVGEDPTEPWHSGPYPHPAVSNERRIQLLSEDFAAQGLQPFHTPLGVMLNEGDPRKSACIRCSTADEQPEQCSDRTDPVPAWITAKHLAFLGWTVFTAHYPALFIGGFLFFLAFTAATERHQNPLSLKPALLVGFFLGGLVVHGGLQGWWIGPLLGRLSETPLLLGATGLTAFNDNAAITYLATLVPNFSEELKYAIVAKGRRGRRPHRHRQRAQPCRTVDPIVLLPRRHRPAQPRPRRAHSDGDHGGVLSFPISDPPHA